MSNRAVTGSVCGSGGKRRSAHRRRSSRSPARAIREADEAGNSEKIPCSRPGCYELFPPDRRSPLKKFCCALCREALRRVRQREARWQGGAMLLTAKTSGPVSRAPGRTLGVEYIARFWEYSGR